MAEPDDGHVEGTPSEERAEGASVDEPMIDEPPDEEAVEEPINSEADAEAEAAWAAHQWVSIAVISIGLTVLFLLGLMQATGLVDVLGPFADTQLAQWAAFGGLVLAVFGLFLWGRKDV